MPATNYRLTMRKGPQPGQQYSLITDSVTIGRDPMVDVVVNDPEVSRQHARLTRSGDQFLVQDLGSTNGTFLDGRRLAGDPVPVAPGQLITIGGNVSLVFEAKGDVGATLLAGDEPEAGAAETDEGPPGVGIFDFPEGLEPVWPEEPDFAAFDAAERGSLEERDTLLDYPSPPHDLSYREPPQELLPDFGPPSGSDQPAEPYIAQQRAQFRGTPPAPPAPQVPAGSNRTRNVIITMLALLLLCCCCLILTGYFWWGDLLMEYLGVY